MHTEEPEIRAALAFTRQSGYFDSEEKMNPILSTWRRQVYDHVGQFMKKGDTILELNAGTGIDAMYFASLGHRIHATDVAEGMIRELNRKIEGSGLTGLSSQQISFERLDEIDTEAFDYVFSNFGGLNCIDDLSRVATHLVDKVKPRGFVTWVIMPPVAPWEWLRLLKGKRAEAFRRLKWRGTMANIDGSSFMTYYHSLADVKRSLGRGFKLVRSESLGLISPPPSALNFCRRYPALSRRLRKMDGLIKDAFPFNRWGDHIIVTFRKEGE